MKFTKTRVFIVSVMAGLGLTSMIVFSVTAFTGCIRKYASHEINDVVYCQVSGYQGTGTVVRVMNRVEEGKEQRYYEVDFGRDDTGKRNLIILHERWVFSP